MSVVYQPERRHWCGPNEHGYWTDFPPTLGHPVPGTVFECGCGKSWVAYKPQQHGTGGSYYMGVKWRRESWWARRWRQRRTT